MALPKLKADATDARLASVVIPEGAPWATDLRQNALSRVAHTGAASPPRGVGQDQTDLAKCESIQMLQ